MKIEEIKNRIQTEDYDFLRKPPLKDNIILLGLGGSYAYGTNNEDSDVDIRGIATHSKEDILTRKGFEQIIDEPTDTVIYSLEKILNLLSNCNPNTIEILGLEPWQYIYMSDVGQELVNNHDMFLSKRAVHAFGGYATSQLRRLDNKAVRLVNQSQREAHILNSIYNAKFRDYKSMWSEMNNIVKDYSKIGKRNQHAIDHNKLGKHMMHLVRLYLMCLDILEYGRIITYRKKDYNFLMDIRNGKYLDDNQQPTKEFYDMVDDLDNELNYWKEHTYLPEQPDYYRINKFLEKTNLNIVLDNK